MKREHMLAAVLGALIALGLSGCGSDVGTHVVTGPAGPQGQSGANGSGCSVSLVSVSSSFPNGGSLITCGDGSSTVVMNGKNGLNGQAGTPGTVISTIKLCGADNSYPNTFTEDAICINNTLYGVMSVNGGFLTALPPGQYSSNGINSTCTFIVGANCKVTR